MLLLESLLAEQRHEAMTRIFRLEDTISLADSYQLPLSEATTSMEVAEAYATVFEGIVMEGVGDVIGSFFGKLASAVRKLWDGVKKFFSNIGDFFKAIFDSNEKFVDTVKGGKIPNNNDVEKRTTAPITNTKSTAMTTKASPSNKPKSSISQKTDTTGQTSPSTSISAERDKTSISDDDWKSKGKHLQTSMLVLDTKKIMDFLRKYYTELSTNMRWLTDAMEREIEKFENMSKSKRKNINSLHDRAGGDLVQVEDGKIVAKDIVKKSGYLKSGVNLSKRLVDDVVEKTADLLKLRKEDMEELMHGGSINDSRAQESFMRGFGIHPQVVHANSYPPSGGPSAQKANQDSITPLCNTLAAWNKALPDINKVRQEMDKSFSMFLSEIDKLRKRAEQSDNHMYVTCAKEAYDMFSMLHTVGRKICSLFRINIMSELRALRRMINAVLRYEELPSRDDLRKPD